MNEGQLRAAIRRRLPREIHYQSTTGVRYIGTPDDYFDGPGGDLWVEFKQLEHMPRSGIVGGVHPKKKGFYTPKQYEWMERRFLNWHSSREGSRVIGIVGLPNKTLCIHTYPQDWECGTHADTAVSLDEGARWIIEHCGS